MRFSQYYLLVLSIFLLCPTMGNSMLAQNKTQKYTISGYVRDASSGEALIGANIFDPESYQGTTSNVYGFYSLTLPASSDSITINVSFIGYGVGVATFVLKENTTLNFDLKPDYLLDTFEVTSSQNGEQIQERSQMSSVNIPIQQIKRLPALLGEVDVIKALQLMPGVQSGGEGNSGLYVRGGGPDQNLMLLDGVPVYNASHLFGFFSVFNADAINSVELIKGGFPARYGGRLSSVVDIRMKEGNMKQWSGAVNIGLISSKLMLEGPLIKDKTSMMIAARRTYIDFLIRPLVRMSSGGNNSFGYYFHDLNAKINHKFSDKDRLYLSTYMGDDVFGFTDRYQSIGVDVAESETRGDIGWGNITAVGRWNHIFTPKLFSNLTLTYSSYDMNIGVQESFKDADTEELFRLNYFSGIEDIAGKIDFDYVPNPSHYIKSGISMISHQFKPGATQFKYDNTDVPDANLDTLFNDSFVDALELDAYIENDMKIGQRLKMNVGLHYSGFAPDSTYYHSLQPRFSGRFLINENLSVKASYANMMQFIHLLSSSGGLTLPTDLWVPATKKIKPQTSMQAALGFAYKGPWDLEYSIEGYYKRMNNLLEYKDGASYLNGEDWEDLVVQGEGEAYGLEFLVQKKHGNTTGWIGYTLAWSNRTFPDINFGDPFPYKYDRRHDISVTLIHSISDRIELSANWVYGTGNAVSLPVAIYPGSYWQNDFWGYNNQISYYEGRNGFRMPSYHRMDVGISFIKNKQKTEAELAEVKYPKRLRHRGERRWNISFYNAYNRKNPFFLYRGYRDSGNLISGGSERVYKQVSLFPIIPSFSYSRTF